MNVSENIDSLMNGAFSGSRLGRDEAELLFKDACLFALGRAADAIRKSLHHTGHVTFVIDRNINYTNVCLNQCGFCAFYRDQGTPDAYLLNADEIMRKVDEAVLCGATQIMLQGGLHPDITIDYFTRIFGAIKKKHDIAIHSLSPPEIVHLAKRSSLGLKETLRLLKEAGLDSLPGGGAEILSDRTRKRVSPEKISSDEWIDVMEAAHDTGLFTTATMMFGIGEELGERIEHLDRIRTLQDRTGMFRAFIPWTFQPGNTSIGGSEVPAEEYLRTLALSRIYLDNIPNIQGSWLTQGEEIGQLTLFFGANDLGSTMLEENVVRSTGVHHTMDVEKIVYMIKKAGFIPAQRDTRYKILNEF